MRIAIVSDFQIPSGYQVLTNNIATDLVKHGHEVTVLGVGYDMREHLFPYTLLTAIPQYVPQMVYRLHAERPYDFLFFVMDIPNILSNMDRLMRDVPDFMKSIKTAGFFPVESDPISKRWTIGLRMLDYRFTFSGFGQAELLKVGLPSTWIEFQPSPYWFQEPGENDLDDYPQLQIIQGREYFLTVAKNQHRKNLPASMRIAARVCADARKKGFPVTYVLVTDPFGHEGWDLFALANELGFQKGELIIGERAAISSKALRALYHGATAFLLTSLAEGIGLPLYEAQAQGCPIVATDCCAIPDALMDYGQLINVKHVTPYPWGDTNHYWVNEEDGVDKLKHILKTHNRCHYYRRPEFLAELIKKFVEG